MTFRNSSRSKRGSVTVVTPSLSMKFMRICSPYTWKYGRTATTTSSASEVTMAVPCTKFATRFRCVSITPLGFPVVPLE